MVKEKELLYSINSFNYTPLHPGLFIITSIGDPGNLENATSQIKKEIQRLRDRRCVSPGQCGVDEEDAYRSTLERMQDDLDRLETLRLKLEPWTI